MEANIIAGIACIISAIAVFINFIYSHKTQRQYIDSLSPLLSFSLTEQNCFLCLSITNNGKSAATDIKIDFKEINQNGEQNEFRISENIKYEMVLYPNEKIVGIIARSGKNADTEIAPAIRICVKYVKGNTGKTEQYERSVCLTDSESASDEKSKSQLDEIIKKLDEISRSENRTANYLEGRWLAKFDELNVAPHGSMYKDMRDARNNVKREEYSCTGRDKDGTMHIKKDCLNI